MAKDLILVVEDDLAVRRGVADALRWAGFDPLEAGDGDLGQQLALTRPVRLVLLDLVLPRRPGLEVLQALRAARPGLPVILLTALGGEDDRVRGLTMGADDYVVKPFSVRELLARVESVLRRSAERIQGPASLAVPGGEVDLMQEEVRWDDGSREPLTGLEANLLRYLASCPGRLLSRDELLQRVWRVDPRRVRTRTLDMTVARLRKKLRDEQAPPRVVVTVRGRGYRLGC